MTTKTDLIHFYSKTRSLYYFAFYRFANWLASLPPKSKGVILRDSPKLLKRVQEEMEALFLRDALNIEKGIYPLSVLKPENPIRHLKRTPRILIDGFRAARKRGVRTIEKFPKGLFEKIEEYPKYLKRNYHFQTDGYFSKRSAEYYEQQVEALFLGCADAMRRCLLPPLKEFLGEVPEPKLLELAAGTGRATRFVKLTLPTSRIIATDISRPYLDYARENNAELKNVDFLRSDAMKVPFEKDHFDCVYSVYLFHECPPNERREILKESFRVLKPGGLLAIVDSLQIGDISEFDVVLRDFPENYHEPFYKSYQQEDFKKLLLELGYQDFRESHHFVSKLFLANKPKRGK